MKAQVLATSSIYVFIFAFALLAISIDGRKDPSGKYWRSATNDHAFSETTNEVLNVDVILPVEEKADCDSMDQHKKQENFVKDFEPRPNVSIYNNNDGKLIVDENKSSSSNEFQPRPNVSVYGDDKIQENKSYSNDFEPRPNVSAYGDNDLKEEKKYVDNFEPRPNVSMYHE